MKQLKYGVLYEDGPLHPELTPLDLYAAGYTIREHREPGKWCHWQKNSFDPKGKGELFGPARDTVEEAIADARWLMTAGRYKSAQLMLAEELADFWPDMSKIPEGKDMFAQYPVAGEPTERED